MPARHQVDIKLPAVSGSSGHLVIEQIHGAEHEPDYPGKVFGNPDLSYAEAMQAFAEASQPISGEHKPEKVPEILSQQAKIRLVRQKIAEERAKLYWSGIARTKILAL